QPTFVDARVEVHTPQVFLDYLAIDSGVYSWQRLLDNYRVDHLVLSTRYQPRLAELVQRSAAWRETYEDPKVVVDGRADAATASGDTSARGQALAAPPA